MTSFSLPVMAADSEFWGPPAGPSAASVLPKEFQQIPYTPFSKSDRIGRIADWNSFGTNAEDAVVPRRIQDARRAVHAVQLHLPTQPVRL